MISQFSKMLTYGGMGLAFIIGRLAVKILPRQIFFSLSGALANLGFYLFRGFRKRSVRNLCLALGDRIEPRKIPEIVQRSLRNFFRDFIEIGLALDTSFEEIRKEIPLRGREHLEAALAKGNGVIVLSAHMGNFFLLGTRLASEGYPAYVLVNQSQDGSFQELMDRYRLKVGQKRSMPGLVARPSASWSRS